MTRHDDDPNGNTQREPAAQEGQRHLGVQKKVQTGSQVLAALLLELLLELEKTGSAEQRRNIKHLHELYSFSLERVITRGRP